MLICSCSMRFRCTRDVRHFVSVPRHSMSCPELTDIEKFKNCETTRISGVGGRGGSPGPRGPHGRVLAVRHLSSPKKKRGRRPCRRTPHPTAWRQKVFKRSRVLRCFLLFPFFPFFGACGSRWVNMGQHTNMASRWGNIAPQAGPT